MEQQSRYLLAPADVLCVWRDVFRVLLIQTTESLSCGRLERCWLQKLLQNLRMLSCVYRNVLSEQGARCLKGKL